MPYDKYKVDLPEGHSGDWRIKHFTVPDYPHLEIFRIMREGRLPPPPGEYTGLYRGSLHDPIMSDTPAEIEDLLPALSHMRGRVLINGLGLGVMLKAVLAKPEVTSIDVVELSADVIRLVAPHYKDPRLTIFHANALAINWPNGTRWDAIWHDIWDNLASDNLAEITYLHSVYEDMCEWQGSWGHDYVTEMLRKEGGEYAW